MTAQRQTDQHFHTAPPDSPHLVSVVIATRNRPEDLERCLPSILANHHNDFELVIVDQSVDGATREVVARFDDPRIRYVHQDAVGKSRAVNAGLRCARGKVLAFTDDDCTVPPDWLSRGISILNLNPAAGLIAGALEPAPVDWSEWFIPAGKAPRFRAWKGAIGRIRWPRLIFGANLIVRREVIEAAGGLDEKMGPGTLFPASEEADLDYRALVAGFTVVDDPENVVTHWGKRSISNGDAARLLHDATYGLGGNIMKHVRCRDPLAALAALRYIGEEAVGLGQRVLRRQRPVGASRLVYLLRGMTRALFQPLDTRRRMFL
jgi:glycosyltransferase involved in cell wall biosynthesis